MKRLSKFRRGFIATFVMDVIARGMSALTLIVLLRSLSVGDFAFIVLLLYAGQFLGSAVTGGIRLRYMRLEAERVSRGHEKPSTFHATLLNGTALILAAAILGLVGATVLNVGNATDRLIFLGLGTGYTLANATIEMTIFHYQAQLAFLKAGAIQASRNAVQLVLALGAPIGLYESGAEVGLVLTIGVSCVALIVAVPLALSTRGSKEDRVGYRKETAALTLYSLVSASWAYRDLFLVAALLNDEAVAAYGAALRYVSIIMGPVPALVSVLRVRTAQQDIIDSNEAQIEMMVRWAKQSALPTFAILSVAAIAAIWAIPILDGGRYPQSVPIFQILLPMSFAQFITLPNSTLLITQQRYTTLAWVNAAALALNVVLAVIAAELVGVLGIAAVGALVCTAQVTTVTYLAAHPPQAATAEPSAKASPEAMRVSSAREPNA